MKRYSPILILLIAISCVLSYSTINHDSLTKKRLSTKRVSLNNDIAFSSFTESLTNLLHFDINLKKEDKDTITNTSLLDTVNKENISTPAPIMMLDDLIREENLKSLE